MLEEGVAETVNFPVGDVPQATNQSRAAQKEQREYYLASSPGHSHIFNVIRNIENVGVAWGRG